MNVLAKGHIVGLTGKGLVTSPGEVLSVPDQHPDLQAFLDLGLLEKLPDPAPVVMTADGPADKAVKPKPRK